MNLAPVDKWTIVHVASGFVAGRVSDVPPVLAMAGAVAYEVAEQAVESTPEGQAAFGSSGPESVTNAMVDLVVFGLAFAVGRALRGRAR